MKPDSVAQQCDMDHHDPQRRTLTLQSVAESQFAEDYGEAEQLPQVVHYQVALAEVVH